MTANELANEIFSTIMTYPGEKYSDGEVLDMVRDYLKNNFTITYDSIHKKEIERSENELES